MKAGPFNLAHPVYAYLWIESWEGWSAIAPNCPPPCGDANEFEDDSSAELNLENYRGYYVI